MMDEAPASAPRILILEPDRGIAANLRGYVVHAWKSASVQSMGSTFESMAKNRVYLNGFDVVLSSCSFCKDGSSGNPTLRALRRLSLDPTTPPVILLTECGSEFTAVQAVKSGAFDYLAKQHMSREQVITAVHAALDSRHAEANAQAAEKMDLFGYDIRRRLASNGNVSVHVAFSAEQDKDVVMKVLHRGRGSLARDVHFERFVEEFKILFDVDDPAAAEIYDFRVTEQYCYIAMEFFPRGHLGRLLNRPMKTNDALRTAGEIAQALAIIHAAGIVHQDLKPGNIMLRDDESIALIDFGISKFNLINPTATMTESMVIAGTPYYMSPEQVRGEDTDERTDIYSLGVILYEMLAGQKPYVARSYEEIGKKHTDDAPPLLPSGLGVYQDLINRLMAKDPRARLSNAREAVEIIEDLRAMAPAQPAESLSTV